MHVFGLETMLPGRMSTGTLANRKTLLLFEPMTFSLIVRPECLDCLQKIDTDLNFELNVMFRKHSLMSLFCTEKLMHLFRESNETEHISSSDHDCNDKLSNSH